MSNEWIEPLDSVNVFISKTKNILSGQDYDFDLQQFRKEEDPADPYTTANTLLDLDYDTDDVVEELLTLNACHYCKTAIDRNRPDTPYFWFFEKTIQGKSVYIKFKIRDEGKKKIFCMSFHFPKWPITDKPYA